jgi:hypothetical protein
LRPSRPSARHLRSLLVLIILVGVFAPRPVYAISDDPSGVVYGNAAPLRRGELRIGVFAPMQYGAQERITLISHPILDLLLTPNVTIRLNLLHRSWGALSLDGGYAQSFLKEVSGGYPGFGTFSAIQSVYLFDRVTLSARLGYLFAFTPTEDFLLPSVYLTVLLPGSYLVHVSGLFPRSIDRGVGQDASGKLLIMRRFQSFLVALGLSVGRPWLLDVPIMSAPVETPVYPLVDVIWEF